MTEAIQAISDLSPLAAVVIIAGIAATIITQGVKRSHWTRPQAEIAAVAVSGVLGLAAYIVSGIAGVFPASVVEVVSTAVVVIAAVALTSHAAYAIIGRAIPDGREHLTAQQGTDGVHVDMTVGPEAGRRARRDEGELPGG